jgi:hypothetical protein
LHGAEARGRFASGCLRLRQEKAAIGTGRTFVAPLHGAAAIACISRHCMEQPLAGARIGLSQVAAGKSRNWDCAYVPSHHCMHQPRLHGAEAPYSLAGVWSLPHLIRPTTPRTKTCPWGGSAEWMEYTVRLIFSYFLGNLTL